MNLLLVLGALLSVLSLIRVLVWFVLRAERGGHPLDFYVGMTLSGVIDCPLEDGMNVFFRVAGNNYLGFAPRSAVAEGVNVGDLKVGDSVSFRLLDVGKGESAQPTLSLVAERKGRHADYDLLIGC